MLAVAARELADGLSMLVVALILISHCCWRPRGASAGRQWSCMLLERRGAVRRLLVATVAYVTEGCRRACETGTRRAIEPRSGRRFWSQRLEPLVERSSCLCEVGYGWRDRDTPDRPLNVAVSAV